MRRAVLSFVLPVLLVNAVPAVAQDTTLHPPILAPSVATDSGFSLMQVVKTRTDSSMLGPSRDGLRAGIQARTSTRPEQPLGPPDRAGLGQSRAMMIVGGAALIVGAVIGHTAGTLIMVGGAVVGLVGLYQYLQ